MSSYKINKVGLTNEKLRDTIEERDRYGFDDRKFETVEVRAQNRSAEKYDEYDVGKSRKNPEKPSRKRENSKLFEHMEEEFPLG